MKKRGNGLHVSFIRERPYLFLLLPAFLIYTIITIYPMINAFIFSLTNWDGFSTSVRLIGLGNFEYMLNDKAFFGALKNTLTFVVMDVVLQNVLGLSLALLLENKIYTRNTLRGLFFIPVVIPAIAASYIWTYIYTYNGGALNLILGKIGLGPFDYIGDPKSAIYFVILAGIWQWVVYRTVIYISGLQAIPAEIHEAAAIDGAGRFTRFTKVTIPMLMPAIKINVTLCTIGALKQFDLVYTMTGGGPGKATEVIATKIFKEAFERSDYGYGCAIGVVLFIIIMTITLLLNNLFNRKEVEM